MLYYVFKYIVHQNLRIMKNFAKAYSKIDEEQEKYVEKIKDTIFGLLEAKGSPQRIGNAIPSTLNILPYSSKHGKEFSCETNGTGFSFNVRISGGYIEASGTVPGPAPVKMITKKWRSFKKLEEEFLKIFGGCFYQRLSLREMLAYQQPINIST